MKAQEKGCLKVMDYNAMMHNQWRIDCQVKMKDGRWSEMPQLAFYVFFNNSGEYRKTGYVAWSGNTAVLLPTKRAALSYLMRECGVTVW